MNACRQTSGLDTFRTADYGQAGYLFALGFKYELLERDSGQIFFLFAPSSALLTALGEYSSNKPVPCRDFFHGLRKAKAIIQEHTYGTQHCR